METDWVANHCVSSEIEFECLRGGQQLEFTYSACELHCSIRLTILRLGNVRLHHSVFHPTWWIGKMLQSLAINRYLEAVGLHSGLTTSSRVSTLRVADAIVKSFKNFVVRKIWQLIVLSKCMRRLSVIVLTKTKQYCFFTVKVSEKCQHIAGDFHECKMFHRRFKCLYYLGNVDLHWYFAFEEVFANSLD